MKTVTYDETQFAIVPIEPSSLQSHCVIDWNRAQKNAYIKIAYEGYVGDCVYKLMIAAAPPYQSVTVTDMVQDKWASLPRELLIRAIRQAIPAVAHASIKNKMYRENYDELDNILSHVHNIEHPAAPKGEE